MSDIRNCYSDPAFFWEGGFFEAINPGEKKKYLTFFVASFNYSLYEQDNTAYDEKLPYFSAVVKAVVWDRYLAYLQNRKAVEPHSRRVEPAEALSKKATPPIAETDNPFDSTLTDERIAFLAEGINYVKMLNVPLSADDLRAIFAGKPHAIVRSNNNRLVAFFFSGLSSRGLITPNWQSVIANYKLFLSKDTTRDKYINQSDLSTAVNYICDIGAEGKYVSKAVRFNPDLTERILEGNLSASEGRSILRSMKNTCMLIIRRSRWNPIPEARTIPAFGGRGRRFLSAQAKA